MTAIVDIGTRGAMHLPRTHDRPLRLCVHLPGAGSRLGLLDARLAVVVDVLVRTVESCGQQALWACVLGRLTPDGTRQARSLLASLGILPPAAFTTVATAGDALGGEIDLHVIAAGAEEAPGGGLTVARAYQVGASRLPGAADGDALAVRLALLRQPYRRPAVLTSHDLDDAAGTLCRWRGKVAQWACVPSKPVPESYQRLAQQALADDLDAPAVLDLLCRAEAAEDLAEGAKFEVFAYLDRLLGLELCREVGRATTDAEE
ncbi:hypothetical protein [Streptomyces noursei]|uniref:hypothetical protein n=1 Tax=Streptomyces noursei TaxID=1971 RepID=UPI00069F90E7|nr:hypothetical protein [Streptomyces noursei]